MPQATTQYDPFRGVRAVEESGKSISDTLLEAKKAEVEMEKTRRSTQTVQWLHNIIDERARENPNFGIVPFLDPKIAVAGALAAKEAPDYVAMLKGISDTNLKALQPRVTRDGIVQLDPKTGNYNVTRNVRTTERVMDEPLPGDKMQRWRIVENADTHDPVLKEKVGEPFDKFNPNVGRGGSGANDKEVQKLMENKDRVVRDFEKMYGQFDLRRGLVEGHFENPYTKKAIAAKMIEAARAGKQFDPKEQDRMMQQSKHIEGANLMLKKVIDAVNKYQEMARNRGYDFEDVYDKAQEALDDENANLPATNPDGSEYKAPTDSTKTDTTEDVEYDYDPATQTMTPKKKSGQ